MYKILGTHDWHKIVIFNKLYFIFFSPFFFSNPFFIRISSLFFTKLYFYSSFFLCSFFFFIFCIYFLGTHDWHKFITPDELCMIVEKSSNALKVKEKQGLIMSINPLTQTFTWRLDEKDLDINYIIHIVKDNKI